MSCINPVHVHPFSIQSVSFRLTHVVVEITKALNFPKTHWPSDTRERSNSAAFLGGGHSSISGEHMLRWTLLTSSLKSYLHVVPVPRPRSRLSIAFILLISFFFWCFAFHLPLLYCFAGLAHKKGREERAKNKRDFHLLKFPGRIWPSPVAPSLHFKTKSKNVFAQVYRKLSGARRKMRFFCSADGIGKGESLELRNWWLLAGSFLYFICIMHCLLVGERRVAFFDGVAVIGLDTISC